MNSFGRLFRVSIFGESHGESIGIVIDGCPAGISIIENDFNSDISKRKSGKSGTTKRIEADKPIIKSGIFNNKTTGAPITILFENKNINSGDYDFVKYIPRPGHADFTANEKFNSFNDYRGGGHFSGRLTLALVTAGVIANKIINPIDINAELISVGGTSDIECAVKKAEEACDSVGGIIECVASRIPVGLGEPFFDSVESLISHAVFSIPAIKAIEFGIGFCGEKLRGSEFNDSIIDKKGKTKTNNNGGINGGITNGNDIVFRVFVKPTPSISRVQNTFNFKENEISELTIHGRHDVCIALRVPVVVEAVTAIVIADLMMINRKYFLN